MKKLFAGMLVLLLVLTSLIPVCASTTEQVQAADALNELGLFLGDGKSYDLDGNLNRVQAVTLLVRILGKEEEAQNGTFRTPFQDVPAWAEGYIGYAYSNSITNGISATAFGSENDVSDFVFLTLVLRALGYSDSGENAQFVWDNPYALAASVGLIADSEADAAFTRGDTVIIFWNALNTTLANTDKTLADTLIEQGIFTRELFEYASNTYKNGRTENVGVPVKPGSIIIPGDTTETEENKPTVVPDIPSEPDVPVVPDLPSEPEVPVVPDTPSEPEVPVVPDTPSEPEVPVVPDTPSEPEVPDTPNIPDSGDLLPPTEED